MTPAPASLWALTWNGVETSAALPARADVVVAGAGLTGLATALRLCRAGREVVVVEARTVGAVTTGNTTGKLSLLQGDVYGRLQENAGPRAVLEYATANREALDWLVREIDGDEQLAQQRTAYTYATTEQGDAAVARELGAVRECGIEAEEVAPARMAELGIPFPVTSAIALPGQWQLHPLRVLAMLAARTQELGGTIVEHCRVTGADVHRTGVRVRTERGDVEASALVLATGTPVLGRGFDFAKLLASRLLVGAYRVPAPTRLPDGMFLSLRGPSRSLRTAVDENGAELLVAGSVRPKPGDPDADPLAKLDTWATTTFPGAERVTWWGAQDYRSVTGRPLVGRLAWSGGRISVATGYDKWGMTNAVAAALAIARDLAGVSPASRPAGGRPGGTTARAISANAGAVEGLVSGWFRAETTDADRTAPREGEGRVIRSGLRPLAVARVDGRLCRVSGVCTHLGGVLQWNAAERSWDCPLHGSRFDPQGDVLEGPATRPLASHARPRPSVRRPA